MKIKIFLIIVLILSLLPLAGLAQFDFDFEGIFFDDFNVDPYIALNDLELVWSTNTYTPFEYQGRTLPCQGSKVTIEAIVKVTGGDPESLKYSWFLENVFQRGKSGYGKDSFSFYVGQRPGAYHTIKLQIFNESRSLFEERVIQIPIVRSEVVVYSSNGNSHFSERTNNVSVILAGKKFSFIAKPYFYSIKKLTDLNFEWRFAAQEPVISSAYDANVLDITIFGKEDEEILEKQLWVEVNNKSDYRQKASQLITVKIY
jgi:hypothetical protein